MVFQRKTDAQRPRFDELPRTTFDPFEEIPAPAAAPESFASPGGAPDPMALMPWMDDIMSFGTSGPKQDGIATLAPARAPTEKRVAEAEPPRPKRLKNDQNWTSLTRGAMPERWAPNTVQLPDDVVRGLDDAHKRTVADGNEHGGNVVRRGENYSARDTGSWNHNSFDVDEKNVGRGNTFVGSYHTHPDTKDPGDQNTTFSESDLENLVGDSRRVSLLRSSQDTHLLAKTKEFDAMVAKAEDPDELGAQMRAAYNATYAKALGPKKDNHAAAMEAATQATAKQFHLLYYSGQGANLKRAGGPQR